MTEGRRLGRGLEALLGPVSREQAQQSGALRDLPVGALRANPWQPRRDFDEAALAELAESIRASGLLQPVIVRQAPGQAQAYELIAGERRWRAVQRLGWATVPAVVRDADDRTLLTLALIENLQRDQLNAIDTALGYERLQQEFDLPQAEVARLVGKDRTTVANALRLLKLPESVQAMLRTRLLSEGHGRALLAAPDAGALLALAKAASEGGWSVRELEAKVRGGPDAPARARRARKPAEQPVALEVRRVEDALRKRLGTDVRVTQRRRGRGSVVVSYYSNDDLARILELVLGKPFEG
ncbi:MAG: ParB/RepB/Spo0J family partition protein [Gemmatimonadales bacterium]|nr:ParB/RepB/Spo0J family partition protein [Gemmatimonadales bacterium]